MDAWPPVPPFYKLYGDDGSHAPPEPPPLPSEDDKAITMFGAHYTVGLTIPSLMEAGVRQLFGETNPVADFKRLNESVMVHYLDLVRGMRQGENQDDRVAAIETILFNMHSMINSRRPSQAREEIAARARELAQEQRRLAAALRDACDEGERLLDEIEGNDEMRSSGKRQRSNE